MPDLSYPQTHQRRWRHAATLLFSDFDSHIPFCVAGMINTVILSDLCSLARSSSAVQMTYTNCPIFPRSMVLAIVLVNP